jgi:hypothetical protein
MENQEIDATKATMVPDENVMLEVISSVIGTGYDKEKLMSDIKSGQIKASDIISNPAILQKYLLDQNG